MITRFSLLSLCLSLSASGALLTLPGDRASTEGNLTQPMGSLFGANTTQVQVAAPELAGQGLLPGHLLTGLRWRLNGGGATNAAFTIADLEITLGAAALAVGGMSTTFADNLSTSLLVHDGAYSAAAGAYPGGATPNLFGPLIAFQTAYVYGGGDLVIQVRRQPTSTAFMIDSSNDHAGAGTSYQTVSGAGFTATSGTIVGTVPLIQLEVVTAPEPAAWALMLAGVALIMARRRLHTAFTIQ